jgi:hypothetical protein
MIPLANSKTKARSAGKVPAYFAMPFLHFSASQSWKSAFRSITLGASVLAACSAMVGCEPEMPQPPPRQSTNPAEDSFYWAIDRMNHAMEMFRPPSSLGLYVRRTITHKVTPPGDGRPNYTAVVTISTKSMFDHGQIPTAKARKQAKEDKSREAAKKLGLDDPFGPVDEDPATRDPLALPEPGSATLGSDDVADPPIPAQELSEKKDYRLEYIENQWKLLNEDMEEHEQMWFDYALQQGEFGPDP